MKYFISYTTRDKEITRDLLESFSLKLEAEGETYVDLIHNDSLDRQKRVMSELDTSDLIILLETENIYKSPWVSKEIERAILRDIPICKLKIEDINRISISDLLNCR